MNLTYTVRYTLHTLTLKMAKTSGFQQTTRPKPESWFCKNLKLLH